MDRPDLHWLFPMTTPPRNPSINSFQTHGSSSSSHRRPATAEEPPSRQSSSQHIRHRSEAVLPATTVRSNSNNSSHDDRQPPWPRRLFSDISEHENRPRHRHSKSRDGRIPRTVTHLASSAAGKFSRDRENQRERASSIHPDDEHRRPSHHDSLWNSTGEESRKSSLGTGDQTGVRSALRYIQRKEIKSMADLEVERRNREKAEQSLRASLVSLGSLATDLTRQLDYTYYNLLERISSLQATVQSFRDLSESTTSLHEALPNDVGNIEQDTRRQIGEFKGFTPQLRKIEALEEQMRAGRARAEELGERLDAVRKAIDHWERREGEWQARVSRRLRILWAVMGTATVVLLIAWTAQTWRADVPTPKPPENALLAPIHTNPDDTLQMIFAQNSCSLAELPVFSRHDNATSRADESLRLFDEL